MGSSSIDYQRANAKSLTTVSQGWWKEEAITNMQEKKREMETSGT